MDLARQLAEVSRARSICLCGIPAGRDTYSLYSRSLKPADVLLVAACLHFRPRLARLDLAGNALQGVEGSSTKEGLLGLAEASAAALSPAPSPAPRPRPGAITFGAPCASNWQHTAGTRPRSDGERAFGHAHAMQALRENAAPSLCALDLRGANPYEISGDMQAYLLSAASNREPPVKLLM